MQDHHALPFGSFFAAQLVYRCDKKWCPYSHHNARIHTYQTSFSDSILPIIRFGNTKCLGG